MTRIEKNPARKHLPKGLMVLYEDEDLLVIDKPSGMLTIGTDREKERTAYFALTNYVRKGNSKSRSRVFIVHRLDRETSGVVVFAKNEKTKRELQDRWELVRKEYLAVVEGVPKETKGTISGYLAENEALRVYSTPDETLGKYAKTDYKVLARTPSLALLGLTLQTGRKHQIRVHLADLGHPIVGDRKYGRQKQATRRLLLHSFRVTLTHPSTRERLVFEAPAPEIFGSLVPRRGGKAEPRRNEPSALGVEVTHHGRTRPRKNAHRRRAKQSPRRGRVDSSGDAG